jgi:hypothetical protein
VFKKVDNEMRNRFPEKFGKPKANTSPVAGGEHSSRKAPKRDANNATAADLSDFQRQIGQSFVSEGLMTLDEYAQQLRELGEI